MEEGEADGNASEPSAEDVIRERNFSKPKNLDVRRFLIQQDETSTPPSEPEHEPPSSNDQAIGGVTPVFIDQPPAEREEGYEDVEQSIGKGLIVIMIGIWTLIGATVGTQLNPIPSAISLLFMAFIGFWLAKKWIPQASMRYLGVAWVIISMKLLYGLSIDAWAWGWYDASPLGAGQTLGFFLLICVGINIALAFYHDEDAIATQATLVFFAIGSATGGVFGGIGVAIVLFIAMVCMHTLAFVRSSGNLASLGIAVSYLWIGLHALSNDWSVFTVEVVPISHRATLFLLMCGATGLNAYVATQFFDKENWLSTFVETIGLGKPTLWAISVSLGMLGALMTIAAHREDTSFALAQLFLVAFAFTTSYLVVRGVRWQTVAPIAIILLPLLALFFVMIDVEVLMLQFPYDLKPYSLFAGFAALLTVLMLLQNQNKVSDHVLWVGAIACSVLLTLLIPLDETSTLRALIISQCILFAALSYLSFQRHSSSIAGASILAPLLWLVIIANEWNSAILGQYYSALSMESELITMWMGLLLIQFTVLSVPLGQHQLNIFRQLDQLSEFGARLKQSNFLKLHHISFIAFLITLWNITHADGIDYVFGTMMLWLTLLCFTLGVFLRVDTYFSPRNLLMAGGVFAVLSSWRYGLGELWFAGWSIIHFYAYIQFRHISEDYEEDKEIGFASILTSYIGFSILLMFTMVLENSGRIELPVGLSYELQFDIHALLMMGVLSVMLLFLRTIPSMNNMLLPSIFIIILFAGYGQYSIESDASYDTSIALVMFLTTAAVVTISGETRRGLTAYGKKTERIKRISEKQERMKAMLLSNDDEQETLLARIDAEQVRLSEGRRKQRLRSGEGQNDVVFTADIHYQPVVVITFLIVLNLGAAWLAFSSVYALESLIFASGFNIILFALARLQAGKFELRMPDILGVESTAFIAMCALVVVHLAGRMSSGVLVLDDTVHISVFFFGIALIAFTSLHQRNDLGLRIPSVIEAVIGLLFIDRAVALIVGGEVPLFAQINPFSSPLLQHSIPMLIVEIGLTLLVLSLVYVDQERESRGLPEHRSSIERTILLIALCSLSWGVASFVFILHLIKRCLKTPQPTLLFGIGMGATIFYASSRFWMRDFLQFIPQTGWFAFILGFSALICLSQIVRLSKAIWITPIVTTAHFLLFLSPTLMANSSLFILVALVLSGATWIVGILEMRRSLRVIGAIDLLIAWIGFAIEAVYGGSTQLLFVTLITSALVLFVVTTLSQANMKRMLDEV